MDNLSTNNKHQNTFLQYIKTTHSKSNYIVILLHMFKFILSILYPVFCLGCGKYGDIVCEKCLLNERNIRNVICTRCATILEYENQKHKCRCIEYLDEVYSVYVFEGIVKSIIKKCKYKGEYSWLKHLLDITKTQDFKILKIRKTNEQVYIHPVPLSSNKLKSRGFNQSDIIAKKLSEVLNVKTVDIAKKINNTTSQALKSSIEERKRNTKDTFYIKRHPKLLIDTIIIVDDIFTSGETVKELSRVLRLNFPSVSRIIAFTLSRAIS